MTREHGPDAATLTGGVNQTGIRAHNERLVLSLVRRHDGLSKAEIARRTGLSAQTVTIIMRALEKDRLLLRGNPRRGKVGQPSIPMALNPDGAFSFGLKIGRRSVDLVLMDFTGAIRGHLRQTYPFPQPDRIRAFVRSGVAMLPGNVRALDPARIAGLGIAMPFELWNWADQLGVPAADMAAWRDYDVAGAFSEATGLPVHVQNDGSAACGAELMFGRGRAFSSYAYFFIGYFIGGGLVIDNTLYTGQTGNAGAFGTIRVTGADGRSATLLSRASLYVLEDAVRRAGGRAGDLWDDPDSWAGLEPLGTAWVDSSAGYLAQAILSACSVIDFEGVILDGNLPASVRDALTARTAALLEEEDLQGIRPMRVETGTLGRSAQVLGGAGLPIMSRFFVDNSVLFTGPRRA